jgi:hypothetical protein
MGHGRYRQAEGSHLTAVGQGISATLIYDAIHETGAPF